jgi:hypothetical protein
VAEPLGSPTPSAPLEIDGRRALVIGVMPAGFAFPTALSDL